MELTDFGWALRRLRTGDKLTRSGWNGKGMFVELIEDVGDGYLPYLQMYTAQGQRVPWVASHSDLLATDWYEV